MYLGTLCHLHLKSMFIKDLLSVSAHTLAALDFTLREVYVLFNYYY
jgi:hypothetical protein